MTSPAALSVAALRVVRTAAGRRVLQVALLLGGLFVLGLFCGERAHAAESAGALGDAAATREVHSPVTGLGASEQTPGRVHRVVRPTAQPAVTATVKRSVKPTEQPVAQPAVMPTAKPVDEAVGRAAEEQAGEGAGESVVRPVRRLVDRAVGALCGVAPSADTDWPELSELSRLPGAPSLPGGTLPGDDGVQPPQGATGDQPGGEAALEGGARKSPDAEYGSAYGPRTKSAQSALVGRHLADRHDGGAVRPVHVPARTPGGVPTGAIVNQSLFDTTSPRHGDLHAASCAEGAPFRLLPGGTAATDDAGVRDRLRDINEFPG